MMFEKNHTSSMGTVQGRYGKDLLLCENLKRFYSMGCIWVGSNPYSYRFPVISTQLILFTLLSRFIYSCLKRFGQSTLSCQILAGIVLGKSVLSRNGNFRETFFPIDRRMTVETVADFGFLVHLFLLGVRIDLGLVKKMGKDAVVIGVASFLTPLTLCMLCINYLPRILPPSDISKYSLVFLIMACSMTTFAGTSHLLSDLRLLNSEIGRLSTLSALVNDTCNCLFFIAISALTANRRQKLILIWWSICWQALLFSILFFGVRPLMLKLSKQNSQYEEGSKYINEFQFLCIIVMAFLFGYLFNIGGMPTGIGCLLYGTIIPGGPPLGSALDNKLDSLSSAMLVPSKFGLAGFRVNLFQFQSTPVEMVFLFLIILAYLAKFFGVVISGLFVNNISFCDSLVLALVMCCRGLVEVSIYISLRESGRISIQAFDSLIISMLVITGISRPLILKLYDPMSKYAGKQIYSILKSDQRQLRVLACVYMEDNVQPIIDLLSATNPRPEYPLSVSVLNLMEIKGGLSAVLEPNLYNGGIGTMVTRTRQMANAFEHFITQFRGGSVIVKHFTSISPYATMHNDVCTVAMDVRANIVILPFHKQKQIDGSIKSQLPVLQSVNANVFRTSPSTVGLLVDRSQTPGNFQPIYKFLRINVLFLGGVDDREALALASRMIGHPKLVSLTLVWLRHVGEQKQFEQYNETLDAKTIREFKEKAFSRPWSTAAATKKSGGREKKKNKKINSNNIYYREEFGVDAVDTVRVLRSFEENCDLCIVGRHHDYDSPLTPGSLSGWSDCPELGTIGDVVCNAEFSYSVLIVKQQKMEDNQPPRKRHSFNR